MKKSILIITVLFFAGCSSSFIKVELKIDPEGLSMYAPGPERNLYLAKQTGDSLKFKWESELYGSLAFNSVLCYDSLVFVNDLSGKIFTFNLHTGKKKGQLKYRGSILTTPIFHKNLLIFPVSEYNDMNSYIIGYDITRGVESFKLPIEGKVISQPLLVNEKVIMITESGTVIVLSARGVIEQKHRTRIFTHSSPAAFDGKIFWGSDDGRIVSLDLKAEKVVTGEKISSFPLNSPVIYKGNIFISDEKGGIFSVETHMLKVLWSGQTGNTYRTAPVHDGKELFLFSLNGNITTMNPETGAIIHSVNVKSFFNTLPLVTQNLIYAPDFWGALHIYDKNSLTLKKSLPFETRMKLTPVLFKNHLIIGMDSGIVQAYEVY